jgi:hypothetical protein
MTTGVRSGWIGNCIGSSLLYRHTTKMKQRLERLLAGQEKMMAEMKTNQEGMEAKTDAYLKRMATKTRQSKGNEG